MKSRQYFQVCRVIMPLVAASSLAACGIDLKSFGEPLFKLAERDSGVIDAATNQPSETAGRSAEGSSAGGGGAAENAADGGGRDADAAAPDEAEEDADAGPAAGSG